MASDMHPLVRDLYKRVLIVGRDYPTGLEHVKKGKRVFSRERASTDDFEIKKAVARGRWYVRNEITGVIKLKKYRAMKQRYYDE